jgi:hypothetical protein
MLAELDRTVVVSEPPSVDRALREGGDAASLRVAIDDLALAVAPCSRLFLKLDSWSVFDIDLLRATYPDTPWVFLYRAPAEIVASNLRERGMHTVPGQLPCRLFGLDPRTVDAMPAAEYCARVLGAILAAAELELDDRCLLLTYEELPDAIPEHLLPGLDIACGREELRRMLALAQFDSKRPGLSFEGNGAPPEPAACAAAERWAADSFARLERAHAAQRGMRC